MAEISSLLGLITDDQTRQALIAQMENHRQDFMVIMAGYPQDMDKLMSANAGLASRMPYTIEFPNYTRDELAQIFMTMVKKSFEWEPSLEDSVAAYFGSAVVVSGIG